MVWEITKMVWEITLDKTKAGNKPHYYVEHRACVGKLMQALMELQQMGSKGKRTPQTAESSWKIKYCFSVCTGVFAASLQHHKENSGVVSHNF